MGNKCDNHEEIKTFSSLLIAQTSVGLLLMLITSLDLLSKASLFQMSTADAAAGVICQTNVYILDFANYNGLHRNPHRFTLINACKTKFMSMSGFPIEIRSAD